MTARACRSRGMFAVAVFVALKLALGARHTSRHYLQASACVNSVTDVTCSRHRKIAIRRIVYGAKRTECDAATGSCCAQKREDCFIYHDAAILSMNTYCSGHRECSASTRVTAGLATNSCRYPPNYGTILYDCIHDTDIVRFGSDGSHTGKRLYLANAEYPSQISPGNLTNECVVTSPRRTKIVVRSIDMVFTGRGYNPRVCHQRLGVTAPGGASATFTCTDRMYYGFSKIYDGFGAQWEISLKIHVRKYSGRIWLTISALEDVPLTVTCRSAAQLDVTKENVTAAPSDSHLDVSYFTIDSGILVGCIAGVAALVFVMFAVVWKCRKRKPHPKCASPRDQAGVRPFLASDAQFPDVCRIHESSPAATDRGDNPTHSPSKDDNYRHTNSHATSPDKSRPTSLKLKKKVSFKDMLSNNEDTQSNGSSRPNSYISGSSFYTFGKVDDDIDDVADIQQRELPPPPDWITQDVDLARESPPFYGPTRRNRPISTNGNIDDFYNDIMSGDVFDDISQFSLYDDIDDASMIASYHGHEDDVMVIENELYQPVQFVNY